MRARLTWILGALGLAGFVAFLRRRRAPLATGPDPRAAELRRTLEESRSVTEQAAPVEAEAESTGDVGARRRDVHERGRSALDEMSPPSSD